jgi:hypothetical protein
VDVTTTDFCLSLFPWTSIRETRGGVKLHIAMNHKGNLSEFVTVTEVRKHPMSEGLSVDFPKATIVAFDRGSTDYECYKTLSEKGIFFVAGLKTNATTHVTADWSVSGWVLVITRS